jgi:CDP-diacylglycerol--glycerol-3-phosphate 3-phosphatidyltransferase
MPSTLQLGWPNRITIIRMLLIGPFVVCLLELDTPDRTWLRWLAIGFFGAMALSDVLDGYLARRLHSESPLGRFLDPLADKLLITTAVIILCTVGVRETSDIDTSRSIVLPSWVAVAAIGKDLVVSIGFGLVYLSTGRVFIRPRLLGKSCTIVQLALVLSMLLWVDLPDWLAGTPEVLWWAATVLAALAAVDYILLGNRYVVATTAAAGSESNGESTDGR